MSCAILLKRATLAFVAVALLCGGVQQAWADVIAGPVLTSDEGGHTNHGIYFTALTNTTLSGFVYHNQGNADTVKLTLTNGTVLETLAVGAGNPSFTASGLAWDLDAGTDYYLLGTTASNGRFVQPTSFPVIGTDIQVNSGVFSSITLGNAWGDFNNITTGINNTNPDITATPEPTSIAVFGLALAGACYGWRRRAALPAA